MAGALAQQPLHHYDRPLLASPFHDRLAAFSQTQEWAPWAGYQSPVTLYDVTMEYTAIRSQASLYDVSPMIKYRITGADATRYLDRLLLRNVAKLGVNRVHYTAWCDDAGKVLDDGTLFRFEDGSYLLCCQERHLPWLLDSADGFAVAVEDVSQSLAGLSLQGPCAFAVLERAGFAQAAGLKPFQLMAVPFGQDGTLTISRTGFTGDLGYELWVAPEQALALWDCLMAAGHPCGLRAIGSAALNMARIEAGFIITNYEFTPAHQALRADRVRSPVELGLAWMIDFDKGHFNGRRALLAERAANTSKWALIGLELDGNVSGEHSLVYHDQNREVGHITSAIWSPTLKSSVALALVERPFDAARNGNLWVEIYTLHELVYVKLMVRARVVPRQFFNPARRRVTPPGRF